MQSACQGRASAPSDRPVWAAFPPEDCGFWARHAADVAAKDALFMHQAGSPTLCQDAETAPKWISSSLVGRALLTDRDGAGLLGGMRPTIARAFAFAALTALCVACNKPAAPASAASEPAKPAIPTIAAAPAPAADPTPAAAPGKFGEPLSAVAAIAAQDVIADPLKYNDKDIKVTGKVSGVCQKKGCWMTLSTGDPQGQSVRISFKDYGFFVPKDCMGKTATVEGHFAAKTISAAEAQHYAQDAVKEGETARKVTAPQHTLALVATGVEIL